MKLAFSPASPYVRKAMACAIATDCDQYRVVHRPGIFLDAYADSIAHHRARIGG